MRPKPLPGPDPPPSSRDPGRIEARVAGGEATVVVTGEIDFATAPVLHTCLSSCPSQDVTVLIVDMRELTFMDGSVLGVLADSSARLRHLGGQLVVENPPTVARKLLRITHLESAINDVASPEDGETMTLAERRDHHDHTGITVGRAEDGAVVVTVHGVPGPDGRDRLVQILDDLIDGQGNLFIAVQLPDADTVDIPTLDVLLHAADRACARRARVTVTTPGGHWNGPGGVGRERSELR